MADLDAAAALGGEERAVAASSASPGFCWGGRIVWMYAAHNPNVAAAVAWYGAGRTLAHAGDKSAHGRRGHASRRRCWVCTVAPTRRHPDGLVDQMRAALKPPATRGARSSSTRTRRTHFYADYRPSYRKEQADDGWKRLTAWFRQYLA